MYSFFFFFSKRHTHTSLSLFSRWVDHSYWLSRSILEEEKKKYSLNNECHVDTSHTSWCSCVRFCLQYFQRSINRVSRKEGRKRKMKGFQKKYLRQIIFILSLLSVSFLSIIIQIELKCYCQWSRLQYTENIILPFFWKRNSKKKIYIYFSFFLCVLHSFVLE